MTNNYTGLREIIFEFFKFIFHVNSSNVFFNVLSDILSMLAIPLILALIKILFNFVTSIRSGYTGKWEQLIYDPLKPYEGEPEKIDIYRMKHFRYKYSGKLRKNIKGSIVGVFPKDRKKRKWKFYGYLDGNILTIIYQSKSGQKSRGCIYLRFVRDNNEEFFKGYYLEEHDGPENIIDKTPLILRKIGRNKHVQ